MRDTLSRGRPARLKTPRRVKLVATALLVITLSAVCLFAVSLFPSALSALSGIVTDHPGYIRATNALVAAICAAFLLWPREGSRLVGRWNEYVGWAFFILFIQYLVRLAAHFAAYVVPEWEPAIRLASYLVIYSASFLNNILFLMAARVLLNKNKGTRCVRPPADGKVLDHVRYYAVALGAGLPRWVWWIYPLTLLALLDWYTVWARLPDTLFSIYCLSWFGYAVRLSLQVRRHATLAWTSFVLVLAYGAGLLIYALNPVIAHTIIEQPASASAPARLMKAAFWPKVDEVVSPYFKESDFKAPDELLDKLTDQNASDLLVIYLRDNPITHPFEARKKYGAGPTWLTPERKPFVLGGELNAQLSKPLREHVSVEKAGLRPETRELLEQRPASAEAERRLNRLLLEDTFDQHIKKMPAVSDVLDGAIFALLFPMKYLLFLPAFVLYLLSLVSVNSFRRALHKTTSLRRDYLSEDGILDVIGRSMDADEVKILIRLPGVMRRDGAREERYLAVSWNARKKPADRGERKIFPIAKSRLLVRVMQTEGSEIVLTDEDKGEEADELRARGTSPQTLVLIPIKFHGGVVGAVWAVFSGYGKYNDGTLEQLKFMAELVAPSVQDFRTMSAVDKFGRRLNRGQCEDSRKSQESARTPAGDFRAATDALVSMLFDLLNPLCVGLLIECGFKTSRPTHPRDGAYQKILQEHAATNGQKRTSLFETEAGPVRVLEDYLLGDTNDPLGKLLLVIPDDKDEIGKPTLAAYYLTRLMIASLVANGIVNCARTSLAVIIHDLGLALNKETLVYEQWFEQVNAAARKAGLLWAVASGVGGSQPLLGRLEYVEIVAGLTGEEQEALQRAPLGCVVHKDPASATRHIIFLKLDDAGRGLWLGVGREGFGAELNFNSPWKEFLEKLAGVSKAALESIDDRLSSEAARRREEEARLKAAHSAAADEWVEQINLIRMLTFHDLINLARVQRDTAKAALEAASHANGASDDQVLNFIKTIVEYTQMMKRVTGAISDLTRWDGPRQCSISEAAQQAEQLVLYRLKQKRVEVQHDIRREAVVNVPQVVVALVVANLLRNAADASNSGGVITIHTEVANSTVSCNVLNDGTPMPDDVREKLFEQPLTPTDERNGWSLFLISRRLQKFGGELRLSYSNASGTCFTLRLPVARG